MDQSELLAITKALADETRYNILREIPVEGRKCCKDLSDCFDISEPTVTHHVNKLSEVGLIESERKRTYHYLRRNQKKLDEYRSFLKEEFDGSRLEET